MNGGLAHEKPANPPVPESAGPVSPATNLPEPVRRSWVLPAVLFVATFASATFAGLTYAGIDAGWLTILVVVITRPSVLLLGLPFSVTLLGILLAHEMGHFLACRFHGIRCTPPYFIPAPISIAGTLGAFIRIKSPFPNRRVLFDVGIAGPIAGFVFVIPALVVGISFSQLIPRGSIAGYSFGEPLLFQWLGKLVLDYSPATHDMIAHPIAMAGWFGLLVTCLNLLPIWQLDGGHIAYSVLGRERQRKVSIVATVGLILLSFLGWPFPSYLLFGVLLLILGWRFRFYHPPTFYDEIDIGRGRLLLSLLALLMLLVSFTPVPISFI